jgi:cytochrome c peroxidase
MTARVPLAAAVLLFLAAAAAGEVTLTAEEARQLQRHSPVPPLPPDETNRFADDPAAARLGQALFFDARLSPAGRVSCASCHDPAKSWTDGRSLSLGTGTGARNTLSLWNVGYNRWYFWDGRADSLWSQALKPMESPTEMAGSRLAVARLISADPALRAAYTALFGAPADVDARRYPRAGGPSSADAALRAGWERLSAEDRAAVNQVFVDVGKAIAAFERRLVSRRAPFDVFVEGLREGDPAKQAALPDAARRGARLFVGRGKCSVCHAGPLFTDGEFHDIGVPPSQAVPLPDIGRLAGIEALLADELGASSAWSDDRNGPRAALVRYLAPRPEVAGQVKTPSLRNVALSAPYMHEGQMATLRDVVRYYSTLEGRRGLPAQQERILVPLQLSPQDEDDLVAFLESLTDTALEPTLLRPPASPGNP